MWDLDSADIRTGRTHDLILSLADVRNGRTHNRICEI